MPFISTTEQERLEMLDKIGVKNFEELLSDIPAEFRLKNGLNLDKGMSEWEITSKTSKLATKNTSSTQAISFLGGGSYDHFAPSVIGAITSRSEFYTAYTPYQAEVSQGTLQTIYEFQSLVCNLTGMDVANASMYDGATALAEAVGLACANSTKKTVLMASTIHPAWLEVVKTFLTSYQLNIMLIPEKDGSVAYEEYEKLVNDDLSCIVVQSPNFFGNIEDVEKIAEMAHAKDALFIMAIDPISMGLLKKPGQLGADIVVAEGQVLGLPQSLGGPYLGIFATTKKLMRKIPGRIVGVTEDVDGKRGFVLTLQTREQHIRREKATSNICSNEALMALSASIYLNSLGEEGLKEVAKNCYLRSHYLANGISAIQGFKIKYKAPFFKEFVLQCPMKASAIADKMLSKNIFAGIPMSKFGGDENDLLIAVTEKRSKEEMDYYLSELSKLV